MREHLRFIGLLLAAALALPSPLRAAPDDTEDAETAANQQVQRNVGRINLDAQIFQGARNAVDAKKRMQQKLTVRIDELKQVCAIDDAQVATLTLAAQGDISRFFSKLEEVRVKFDLIKDDEDPWANIWQDIGPLQAKYAAGMFAEDSLFEKSIKHTLAPQQNEKIKAVAEERKRYVHIAMVEASVMNFEQSVPLRAQQREKLIQLLMNATKPPQPPLEYANAHLLLQHIARLPPKEREKLFDERQLKMLAPQLPQFQPAAPFPNIIRQLFR